MGLESGTGIGDLVPTNPLSTDAVSAGDDHIRLIKTVMQSITFLKSIQTFTASGTWTRPANVRYILVYCLGGGGGGNGSTASAWSGGGGSSGAIALRWVDVSALPGGAATVTIGTGGVGGATGGGAGGPGTQTSFQHGGLGIVYCLGYPGIQGGGAYTGGDSAARSLSVGDIIFPGSPGHYGMLWAAPDPVFGGQGGGTGGSSGAAAPANGGGGGGGGSVTAAAGNAGGNGGSGYCIVLEFGW
jgi:hypothetical protein